MRLVYVNLHDNGFFVTRMRSFMVGKKNITKHRFLLNWMIENKIEVINYITPSCNLFPSSFFRAILKGRMLQTIMARFVFWLNHIPNKSVKSVNDLAELHSDDMVIYYGTFDETQYDTINQIEGIKVIDHIHFYGNKEKAEELRDKGFKYYFYDVDLKKYSILFQKNYSWFDGIYIERPYAYEDRFENRVDFARRKNKAMAIGTLTKCPYPELVNTYGEYYQPRRKMILDHVTDLSDILDSYISEYQETELKCVEKNDFILLKMYKRLFNFYNLGKQKKYFSFNMVDKFNEYKLFICPEDVNGSYGIGTIEGMACGCAMIGWNYGAFEDMGMVAGRHYISYDGTLEDLRAKIEYYQMEEHQEELARIARTGCVYVRNNYSQEKVAERYYNDLKAIHDNQI